MKKECLLLCCGILLCSGLAARAGESRAEDRGGGAAKYHRAGEYAVRGADFPDLRDASRNNRNVPIKAYFPASGENFPLVIFSHGGGGTRDSHMFQAKHLASHGYVVVCPEHVYSNARRVRFYMSRSGGGKAFKEALFQTTRDAAEVLGRPKDISFAIDQAEQWNRDLKILAGKIDTERIAVMGHSYGAYTTLAVCGARPALDYLEPHLGNGLSGDLSDPRVTFGLAMSPQPPGGTFFNEHSYATINRPLVGISGSKDAWKNSDDTVMPALKRWDFWKLLPDGSKYFLWLENADHLSFSDGPRSWIMPSASRRDAQRISKAMMVLFCDHFLKQDRQAGNYMNADYADSLRGGVVSAIQWLEK